MTGCDHHIWGDSTGLTCIETDEHDTHRFESTSGDVPGQQKSDGGGDDE